MQPVTIFTSCAKSPRTLKTRGLLQAYDQINRGDVSSYPDSRKNLHLAS
jgi:hypothetical protein